MIAFVLDVVEAKLFVVVSKRFKVAETSHSVTLKETFHFYLNLKILPPSSFLRLSSVSFSSFNRCEFAT
jgi:hypothetical protein